MKENILSTMTKALERKQFKDTSFEIHLLCEVCSERQSNKAGSGGSWPYEASKPPEWGANLASKLLPIAKAVLVIANGVHGLA